jgi:hypothetical protein
VAALDSGGANCSNIASATSTTYTLTSADVGSTLVVSVTATNTAGQATASSSPSAVVAAAPPVNTSLPTVLGTAQQGQTLSASQGGWSGTAPISYAYQWQRCDSNGANCANIASATSAIYTLTSGDVGSTVLVAVTASNTAGQATAYSAATGVVQPASSPR